MRNVVSFGIFFVLIHCSAFDFRGGGDTRKSAFHYHSIARKFIASTTRHCWSFMALSAIYIRFMPLHNFTSGFRALRPSPQPIA